MPALDFPSSPTVGQQFTSGIQTWQWDGISWNIIPTVINTNTGYESYRNLIDNGAMAVCQKVTPSTGARTATTVRVVDRWMMVLTTSNTATWTISQEAQAPAGTGLSFSEKWLCTIAGPTPTAPDYVIHTQSIEGQFLQHLLWGTALAKPLTLSFWVRSNKTGIYVAELRMPPTYGIVYTINVADVWEYKTITFPGNTVTALTNDNAGRLSVQFWLQAGSTYNGGSSIPAAWNSTDNTRVVGQVNVGAAVNNYWQITGVQLEPGSAATPFEHRSYDREFRKCQRYFQRWTQPPLRGAATSAAAAGRVGMPLPVPMRVAPTSALSAAGVISVFDGVATPTVSSISNSFNTPLAVELDLALSGGSLTVGRPVVMYQQGVGYIDFSAEI